MALCQARTYRDPKRHVPIAWNGKWSRNDDQLVMIDPTTVYFVGNRLWWSVALFLGPIGGAELRGQRDALAADAAPCIPAVRVVAWLQSIGDAVLAPICLPSART